jgi:hypothetical protein
MKDIQVTDYLTWEYCTDPEIQYLNCVAPEPIREHMPTWFKQLKARNPAVDISEQQTVRNCLGFRGLSRIGYTRPLPETLDGDDTYFSRGQLHPQMLYGTHWANQKDGTRWAQNDSSPYEYRIRLLIWPWRAKMAQGWRLLILPYLLDWSTDWNEFAGTVEPNYQICDDANIGNSLKWTQRIDTNYNYYNLETAIAIKRSAHVAQGTLVFCALPLFDPELKEKQIKCLG